MSNPPTRFIDDEAITDLPPPEWLIEGVIPCEALVGLYGPPAVGKSLVSVDWSLRLAKGLDTWADRQLLPGFVVYVAPEGFHGLGSRVRAWKIATRMFGRAGVWFDRRSLNLMSGCAVETFIRDVVQQQDGPDYPTRLVVIDTLARCMVGGDENAPKDMGLMIHGADELRRRLQCSVLFLHHPVKRGPGERGHGAFRAGLDTLIRVGHAGRHRIQLVCEKQKDAAPFKPIELRLRQVEQPDGSTSMVVEATGYEGAAPRLSTSEQAAFAALIQKGGQDVATRAWHEATDLSEPTFYRVARSLVSKGLVSKVGAGRNTTYTVAGGG